jgi:hypothetical protein
MEQIPVRQQFILVKFRPGFDQTPLFLWKGSGYHLHRIDRKHGSFAVKIRVEMNDWCCAPASENIRITIPKKRLSSGT